MSATGLEAKANRAASIVAAKGAALHDAEEASARAHAAAADDPSDEALEAAKSARRAVDDARRDLELAQAHATKVSGELAAAARAELERRLADRESKLEPVLGPDEEAMSVEISALVAALDVAIEQRARRRLADEREIDGLKEQLGIETYRSTVGPDDVAAGAWNEAAKLGLATAEAVGFKLESRPNAVRMVVPTWSRGFGLSGTGKEARARELLAARTKRDEAAKKKGIGSIFDFGRRSA